MKVLLLHQHFNTPYKGGAIRSYYLAKALVEHGISTTVITAHNGKEYKFEIIDGIEVHYLPVPYQNRFGFYRRSLAFMRYVSKAVSLAGKIKDIDICYAMSVPLTVGIAARKISSKYKIPFIFEVGDLWPDAPIQMGFIKNRLFQNSLYSLEKRIYKSAKSVVALSPSIQAAIERKIPGKEIHLIPNISDTDFFKPELKNPLLVKKFEAEGKFVVSYIGAIGIANGLEHFVSCAKSSADAGLPIHFILCGDGALLGTIKEQARQLNLQNFLIVPFQKRDGVREILNVTDASFISYKPVPILETGSPNKYFDGLAAGKLIVVNFSGWIREEIEKHKCGVFVSPHSPSDFVKLITPFLNSTELTEQFKRASRALGEGSYSRKMLGRKFADILLEKIKG